MVIKIIIFIFFQICCIAAFGGCPCNCTSCTYTSSSPTDPAGYTVTAGQKLCIPSGSTVTGSITLNGGTICNSGTFSPSSFTYASGTFDNCGLVTVSLTINGTFSNCSNGTINSSGYIIVNSGTFTNNGNILLSGGASSYIQPQNTSTFTNNSTGSICVSAVGSFVGANNSGGSYNYGYIKAYDFNVNNTATFHNECVIDVLNNFTNNNGGTVTGSTSVFGRFNVSGNTFNIGTAVFGTTATQKLDICDAGSPPGGWDAQTGTVGAAVTYCANNSTCTPSTACTTLPVELIYFNADCNNNTVYLEWETGSEINNDFFDVQRSNNGTEWETVGIIKGAGNSSISNYYRFQDQEINYSNPYYRIKQTDYDGRYEYFGPVSVKCLFTDQWNLILNNIPADDELHASLFISEDAIVEAEIFDLMGKNLISKSLHVSKGSNFLRLDLKNISSGTYFIRIKNSGRQLVRKFCRIQ